MTDTEADVLVVGSGATGLTAATAAAATGRDVLLVEADTQFGGTTALSGGRVWIPANGTPENSGDSDELAHRYLEQIFDRRYDTMIRTFVRCAREMRGFIEEHTAHRFVVCPHYPDYHQDKQGATCGGRCFDVGPVDLATLMPEASAVRHPPGYTPITHAEWETWRYPAAVDHELLTRRLADGIRTGGVGLVAALLDGAVRAGVRVRSETALTEVLTERGAVHGARLHGPDGERTVAATAVILATGGFDASEELRTRLLPEGLDVSASAPGDTGVALTVAEQLGLALDNLGEGWWMPMAEPDGDHIGRSPYPRGLVRERGAPRQIVVDRHGHRFLDEAAPYNEFGKAMHRPGPDGVPAGRHAHLVFDHGFRERYPLPGLTAAGELPHHIMSAPDLAGLATLIGVEPHALAATVERWNAACDEGVDHDFARGADAYDAYYGDPALTGNRCLGPLNRGPYYALRIRSGVIGSKGGPVTDTNGAALTRAGHPLPGLYAAGNAAAFWTSDGYPGPGATLGLGMTFGYLAGRAAARATGHR